MIPVGTKVEVIASATKGKGAKIRKGSLGYVTSCGQLHDLPRSSLPVYVMPARVVFTRFGYASKERSEIKFVAAIYPSRSPKTLKNPESHLNKKLRQCLDGSDWIRNIFQSEGLKAKKITPVVLDTLNTTTNITSSKNEFRSWLRSILLSGILHKIVYSPSTHEFQKTLEDLTKGDQKLKSWLMASMASKQHAEEFCDYLFTVDGCSSKGKTFIDRLQTVLQLNKRKTIAKTLENFKNKPMFYNTKLVYQGYWQLSSIGAQESIIQKIGTGYGSRMGYEVASLWKEIFNDISKTSV